MILILYVESGSGSFSLAKNIQRALSECRKESRLVSLNTLLPPWLDNLLFGHYKHWCMEKKQHFSPLFRLQWFYPALYKLLPVMMCYKSENKKSRAPELFQNVDAVISCSFFCGWFSRFWQKKSGRDFPIYGVLGDYTVSPGWKVKIDHLFIPFNFENPVFDYMRKRGTNITVSGIPVSIHSIQSSIKGTVMLCGGGWGLHITANTIEKLLALDSLTRLIVMCGTNDDLYHSLRTRFTPWLASRRLEVNSFTEDMSSFYGRTEIIVTKAGGLTLTEAATSGKPIIISSFLPGHEEDNLQFFLRNNAAIYAESSTSLCKAVDSLLTDEIRATMLTRNAAALVNQQAAHLICKVIAKDINNVDA